MATKAKPNANAATTAQDQAPIFVACEEGDLEQLDTLLAGKHKKTLLTTHNSLGRYPIHIAALAGRLPVLERLVKAGYVISISLFLSHITD